MGPHRGAVKKMQRPVQGAGRIVRGLEGGQDAVPDSGPLPAAEAGVHRLPGTIPFGEIAPRHASGQAPEHAIDDEPMVMGRSTAHRSLRGQERLQALPLHVG